MHGAEDRTVQDIFTGGCFMLKARYRYITIAFYFRRSADSQIALPLPLTTGTETKLRPVEVAAAD